MSDNNPSAPSSSSDQHDDRQQPYQQPQNPMGEGGDGTRQTPLYPDSSHYGPNDRWNTLCIVGFALAFIIPVVGLILSIIALNQINKTGGKSRGLSIAGIIIGGISTVLTVIGIIFGFWIIGQTIKGIDTDSDSWSYCYGDSCDEDWDDSMNSTAG